MLFRSNINEKGIVQLLPSVSGYIGADIVGDILVTDFEDDSWNLLIDIGTNGEIVLGNSQELYSCSAAAGPAFEGAKITQGLAGVPGAISSFNKKGWQTIADKPPRGICGSGLLDIIGELLDQGFIDKTGAFKKEEELSRRQQQRMTTFKEQRAFIVVSASESEGEKIILTQKDIREFQLAKGAIAAGIQILVEEAGINYDLIDNVYLAGGFGNFIGAEAACKVGLIPAVLEDKILRIGNGAGLGAKAYLLDQKQRQTAVDFREVMEYIELSTMPEFQAYYMENMMLQSI